MSRYILAVNVLENEFWKIMYTVHKYIKAPTDFIEKVTFYQCLVTVASFVISYYTYCKNMHSAIYEAYMYNFFRYR